MKSSYCAAFYLGVWSPTHIKSGGFFGGGHCKVMTLKLMEKTSGETQHHLEGQKQIVEEEKERRLWS